MKLISPTYINVKGRLLDLATPQVMGILNVTPDSFYSGSRMQTQEEIAARARQIIDEGASIIDIGAYSSRPNAEHITAEEEMNRLRTGLEIVNRNHPDAIVSVASSPRSPTSYRVNPTARSDEDGRHGNFLRISRKIPPEMFVAAAGETFWKGGFDSFFLVSMGIFYNIPRFPRYFYRFSVRSVSLKNKTYCHPWLIVRFFKIPVSLNRNCSA